MLSAVTGDRINNAPKEGPNKALILQHRDELVDQNSKKFRKVNPNIPFSLFDAKSKSWGGRAIFGMVQTSRAQPRKAHPPARYDHGRRGAPRHRANSYQRHHRSAPAKKNPNVKIFGVTATPNRGDGTPCGTFDNVADQITIGELIATGHLGAPAHLRPRRRRRAQLQASASSPPTSTWPRSRKIMDREIVTDQIVKLWVNGDPERDLPSCRGRPTVVFCSTVAHAEHVTRGLPRGRREAPK
jgi:DNA repair protein RadD